MEWAKRKLVKHASKALSNWLDTQIAKVDRGLKTLFNASNQSDTNPIGAINTSAMPNSSYMGPLATFLSAVGVGGGILIALTIALLLRAIIKRVKARATLSSSTMLSNATSEEDNMWSMQAQMLSQLQHCASAGQQPVAYLVEVTEKPSAPVQQPVNESTRIRGASGVSDHLNMQPQPLEQLPLTEAPVTNQVRSCTRAASKKTPQQSFCYNLRQKTLRSP